MFPLFSAQFPWAATDPSHLRTSLPCWCPPSASPRRTVLLPALPNVALTPSYKPPRFKCCAEFCFRQFFQGTTLYAQGPQFWRFLSRHSFPHHHQLPSDLNLSVFFAWIQSAPSKAQYEVERAPHDHCTCLWTSPASSICHGVWRANPATNWMHSRGVRKI